MIGVLSVESFANHLICFHFAFNELESVISQIFSTSFRELLTIFLLAEKTQINKYKIM